FSPSHDLKRRAEEVVAVADQLERLAVQRSLHCRDRGLGLGERLGGAGGVVAAKLLQRLETKREMDGRIAEHLGEDAFAEDAAAGPFGVEEIAIAAGRHLQLGLVELESVDLLL